MNRRADLRDLAAAARSRADTAPSEQPTPTAEPDIRSARSAAATRTRRRIGSTKVTLSVPPEVAAALRTWAADNKRTLGDGLLSALIDALPAVQSKCAGDNHRIQLGLAPLALKSTGERVHLTVRLPTAGLDELDSASAGLSLSRSDLATALVTEHLGIVLA